MEIRPFRWDQIKKLSRSALATEKWYRQLAESAGLAAKALGAITDWLSRYLEVPCDVSSLGFTAKSFGDFLKESPKTAVTVILSLLPLERKIVALVDRDIVATALARILGGSPSAATAKAWTEVEKGLVEYLFVKVVSELKVLGGKAKLLLRLDRVAEDSMTAASLYKAEEPVIVSRFKVEIASYGSVIAVGLPHAVCEPLAQIMGAAPSIVDDETNRLAALGHIPTTMWAEAGTTNLGLKDLTSIKGGDVLLFDRTEVRLVDGILSGRLVLRVGRGEAGGIAAEILPSSKGLKTRISEMRSA